MVGKRENSKNKQGKRKIAKRGRNIAVGQDDRKSAEEDSRQREMEKMRIVV